MPTTPKTVVGMPIIRYSIESIEDTSNTMPNITATMLAINPTTKRMRFIENSPFILFYSHVTNLNNKPTINQFENNIWSAPIIVARKTKQTLTLNIQFSMQIRQNQYNISNTKSQYTNIW